MNNKQAYSKALAIFKELETMVDDYMTRNKVRYGREWRDFNEAVFEGWTVHDDAFISFWYENYESYIDYTEELEELEAVTASMVRRAIEQESEEDIKAGKLW